jgi:hypothetical protein
MYDRATNGGRQEKAKDDAPVQLKAASAAADLSSSVQRKHAYRKKLEANPGAAGAMAQSGLSGGKSQLPHLDKIQAAFGKHDVSGVEAHVGGPAEKACNGLMAHAYATGGNSIAFRQQPNLHVAAHEATHIVQQRSGTQIPKGLTPQEHNLEKEADEVADAVVQGKSAEPILDKYTGKKSAAPKADAGQPASSLAGDGNTSASAWARSENKTGPTMAFPRDLQTAVQAAPGHASGAQRSGAQRSGAQQSGANPTEEVREGPRSEVENWASFDPARVPKNLRKPKARAIRRQDYEEPLVHHAKPRTEHTKHTVNQYDPRPGKTSKNEVDPRPGKTTANEASGSAGISNNEPGGRGSTTVNEYIEEPGRTTTNELHAGP